jgi:predicted ATP-grasp superfamily ATP-dependent carboligase
VAGQGEVRLLGVTRQLFGHPWPGASGFRYVGSVGPVSLDGQLNSQLRSIGECLTAAFDLRGLFGVDVIVGCGKVWTIEINPRFTASVEIHERAADWCALSTHSVACEGAKLPATPLVAREFHGKAVVYATHEGVISSSFCEWVDWQNRLDRFPAYADIPGTGTKIASGRPILTVLAHGARVSDVCRLLRSRARAVRDAICRASCKRGG